MIYIARLTGFSGFWRPVRRRLVVGAAAAVFAASLPAVAQAAPTPEDEQEAIANIDDLHAGIEHLMAHGRRLGRQASADYMAEVVDRTYNLNALTAQAVGPPAFRAFEDADREKVVAAYREFVIANYVDRFGRNLPISFGASVVEPGPRGALLVRSVLNRPTGDPVQLGYIVVTSDNGALGIADVIYNGVSESARRRAELSPLAEQGADALATALREKSTEIMTKTEVRRARNDGE